MFGERRFLHCLDSGSQVTLICQSLFEQEILPHIQPSDREKAEAYPAVSADSCQSSKTPHFHVCGIRFGIFWALLGQKLGFLLPKNPMELLDTHHKTKLPGMISWDFNKIGL